MSGFKDAVLLAGRRGEVFYDAHCPFCVWLLMRFGHTFRRRGFLFLPLDTPGVAENLGISPVELNRTMHLRLADGRVVTGVDAWRELFRAVTWLRPLAALLGVPGTYALACAAYRWLAANRHCLGGNCRMAPSRPPHPPHRATTFLELP